MRGAEDDSDFLGLPWTEEQQAEFDREIQASVDVFWMDASSSDVLWHAQEEAEFMVGYALDAQRRGGGRNPYYLVLADGRRIEVAVEVALLKRTRPRFVVRRHDPQSPLLDDGVPRPAPDGHVLAFATTLERRMFGGGPWPPRETVFAPFADWAEWDLWVLPEAAMTARPKSKIRVAELAELAGPPVAWTELADKLDAVVPPRST